MPDDSPCVFDGYLTLRFGRQRLPRATDCSHTHASPIDDEIEAVSSRLRVEGNYFPVVTFTELSPSRWCVPSRHQTSSHEDMSANYEAPRNPANPFETLLQKWRSLNLAESFLVVGTQNGGSGLYLDPSSWIEPDFIGFGTPILSPTSLYAQGDAVGPLPVSATSHIPIATFTENERSVVTELFDRTRNAYRLSDFIGVICAWDGLDEKERFGWSCFLRTALEDRRHPTRIRGPQKEDARSLLTIIALPIKRHAPPSQLTGTQDLASRKRLRLVA